MATGFRNLPYLSQNNIIEINNENMRVIREDSQWPWVRNGMVDYQFGTEVDLAMKLKREPGGFMPVTVPKSKLTSTNLQGSEYYDMKSFEFGETIDVLACELEEIVNKIKELNNKKILNISTPYDDAVREKAEESLNTLYTRFRNTKARLTAELIDGQAILNLPGQAGAQVCNSDTVSFPLPGGIFWDNLNVSGQYDANIYGDMIAINDYHKTLRLGNKLSATYMSEEARDIVLQNQGLKNLPTFGLPPQGMLESDFERSGYQTKLFGNLVWDANPIVIDESGSPIELLDPKMMYTASGTGMTSGPSAAAYTIFITPGNEAMRHERFVAGGEGSSGLATAEFNNLNGGQYAENERLWQLSGRAKISIFKNPNKPIVKTQVLA